MLRTENMGTNISEIQQEVDKILTQPQKRCKIDFTFIKILQLQ